MFHPKYISIKNMENFWNLMSNLKKIVSIYVMQALIPLTSVLAMHSRTQSVVLTSCSTYNSPNIIRFLIAYVPFVGVVEYSRSCSLCMITTDNWLTSRLAINLRRWSTADDTSLALLVPVEAVNPNTCKKFQMESFKKGCDILLYRQS